MYGIVIKLNLVINKKLKYKTYSFKNYRQNKNYIKYIKIKNIKKKQRDIYQYLNTKLKKIIKKTFLYIREVLKDLKSLIYFIQ